MGKTLDQLNDVLSATLSATELLLFSGDWRVGMQDVLSQLGKAAGVSRVYLFENQNAPDGALLTSQRFEWVAEGVAPQLENPELQNYPLISGGFERWVYRMENSLAISGNVASFPSLEREKLLEQGIQSILVVPVFVHKQWWGFIGFDECSREREWNQAEIDALQIAANTLGTAIERQQHQQELEGIALLSKALRKAATSEEIYVITLDETLELFGGDGAAALILCKIGDSDFTVALGRGAWAVWTGRRLSLPMHSGAPSIVPSHEYLDNEALTHPFLAQFDLPNAFRSIAGFPLIIGENAFGALWVGRDAPITGSDMRLLSALADIAANAIHRSLLHEQTQQQVKWLETLHQIDRAISNILSLRTMLDLTLSQGIPALKADAALVTLYNPVTNTLDFAAGVGLRSETGGRRTLKPGQSLTGRVALTGKMVYVPDLHQVKAETLPTTLLSGEHFTTYYGVPLFIKGQLKGVLEVYYRESITLDRSQQFFLETLAQQIAIAVDNIQLFENLQRSNLELSLAYESMIECLGRIQEMRESEPVGHSSRMADMAVRLAKALRIPNEELVHIRRGALLCDIGKLGLPDRYPYNPTLPDKPEWMIQQPQFAFQLLAPIEHLRKAMEIPYCYHERWDGEGFPRGLKGTDIPLAARIFAVVYIWDALGFDHPNRPAWKHEDVLRYIEEQSGKYFDPQVVEAFLQLLAVNGQAFSSPS